MLALLAMLGLCSRPAAAQSDVRPWLEWKTTETEHFLFHYPAHYRAWTLALASRMEGVRAQVDELVGFGPRARVHVVVDDPMNEANGYAFTPLDAPTIVLWPTPPDPRSEIGNYRVWQELLATHEYAHVAQLTRPSRNRVRRLLWSLSPVPFGPITTKAPRWLLEGYATYVEGRVTGTGRPNNAWRAAILRQFAIEGRLPSYAQLDATGGWESGSFAYLAGSAYLEWLARRQGDSSVVALWRRMTAVTDRSFEQSFTGVYGDSPSTLYSRFSAEVTAEALGLETAMRREGLVQGALVQRLARNTGDPAISPDGRFLALTVRRNDAPSQLVVWRTATVPDSGALRHAAEQRRRDPEDVPDRAFYPAPMDVVISLVASDGAPYETPRWFADNRHLLVTRAVPRGNGTVRSDLYIWSAEDGDLRRVTHGAGLRDADPSPDGRWAAAVRCDQGWCDLVRVDLATGSIRVLRGGSVTRNYYRPRISRAGEIVVGEQLGDRWRVLRVSVADGTARYADPDDGVTRYDATWSPDGRSIVATSEATGIANLERLDSLRAVTRLTSVTGAAVAADVAPDGGIWFLSLHAGGFDVRRLAPDSARVQIGLPASLALADSLLPVLPPRLIRPPFDSTARAVRRSVGEERDYGRGPARFRLFPAAAVGFGGSSLQLSLVRSDPVGRFAVLLRGAAGAAALPAGAAFSITSHASPTILSATGWFSHEAASRAYEPARDAALDLKRWGVGARADRLYEGDGGDISVSVAALSERQDASTFVNATRVAGIFALDITRRQRDEETRYQESVATVAEYGRAPGGAYLRQRSTLFFGTGTRGTPLGTLRLSYGTVGGGDGAARESFVIGSFASPLVEPLFDARRVDAPAYPLGSAVGSTFASFRVALPLDQAEVFYAGASTDLFGHPLRSFGVEVRRRVAAVSVLGTPAADILTGVARAVDDPVKGTWRFFLSLSVRP